jgi:pilus assembly protein CpaC
MRFSILSTVLAAALSASGPAGAQSAANDVSPASSVPMALPLREALAPVNMFVGEVRSIPVRNVVRVALGNGKTLTTTVLDNEVLLLAEAPGDTSLFLYPRNGPVLRYRIRVGQIDTFDAANRLREMLKSMPTVKVDSIGDQVVLTGSASKDDLKRVQIATAAVPRALNLVKEEDITMKKMVYLKLQIMEFKKNALENLGVDWTTNIAGPAGAFTADLINNSKYRYAPQTQDPTFTLGQGLVSPLGIKSNATRGYLGIATVIASRINLAITNGDAWTLAAPELSTRSGGEAKFLAGGQVPLPTVSATGQSNVTFKDYGIRLLIKPVADEQDNIVATIQTELSAIDPSVTVQGIPGFTTRVTDSEVNLKSGQTLVISGVLSQNSNNSINKLPLLGDLPVLGNLFKSTNFQAGRTDLVIFVTPTITDPGSTQNQQRLDKSRDLRDRFEHAVGGKGIVD